MQRGFTNPQPQLLGRPYIVTGGLMYKMLVMFFLFFRHAFSEFPRPIALKLWKLIGLWLNFIVKVQN